MRYFLAFLLLNLTENVLSQDFQPIYSNRESLYAVKTLNQDVSLRAIKIDSLISINQDSIFYNYKQFEDTRLGSCKRLSDTTWLGAKVLVSNSQSVFSNLLGLPIQIPRDPSAEFELFRINSDSVFFGINNPKTEINFHGFKDSVLNITIQLKVNGVSQFHPFNGKKIQIGKKLGFIKAFNFLNFPNDTNAYQLVGTTFNTLGFQNFSAKEIFEYNIGDEFHYHYYYHVDPSQYSESWTISQVINKSFNGAQDSVKYVFNYKKYDKHEEFINNVHQFSVTSSNTYSATYPITNSSWNSLPLQLTTINVDPDRTFNFLISKDYQTDFLKVLDMSLFYTPSQGLCGVIGDGPGTDYYAKGIGRVLSEGYMWFDQLEYFKKGSSTWGIPFNWNQLMSVMETEAEQIRISPNPFNDQIRIEGKEHHKISLLNSMGQVIIQKEVSDIETLDTSDLAPGIYILNVNDQGILKSFKLVKF